MADNTTVNVVISPRGVEGLNICGPLRGHPAALRLASAVLPALGPLDAMIRDFADERDGDDSSEAEPDR